MSLVFSGMFRDDRPDADATQARVASTEAAALENRVERLALVCEALWTLLRDKAGAREEELIDRIMQLDLADGKLDGKSARASVRGCARCGRPVGKRFDKCMYCGEPAPRDPFA